LDFIERVRLGKKTTDLNPSEPELGFAVVADREEVEGEDLMDGNWLCDK
jgi:hypothetical protein